MKSEEGERINMWICRNMVKISEGAYILVIAYTPRSCVLPHVYRKEIFRTTSVSIQGL